MEFKTLEVFIDIAAKKPIKRVAVAAAEDEAVLVAVSQAEQAGIIIPILVGNRAKIEKIARDTGYDISKYSLIEENDPAQAARICVKLIRENKAQIIMKGMVNTPDYLKAVLDKEIGLRKGDLLSHLGFFEIPNYHKLLALTDAAQNIAPTFEEKISIIKNSVDVFHRLGIEKPKIAVVCAVENVNTKMDATIHAALLTMMNKRKQINGCMIDGPLGFDNAISKESAEHKGIISDVAGDPDLLLAPDIEAANTLYKSFTYFGNATVAAIIVGATAPIVLTSRTDSERSKLMSLALAAAC